MASASEYMQRRRAELVRAWEASRNAEWRADYISNRNMEKTPTPQNIARERKAFAADRIAYQAANSIEDYNNHRRRRLQEIRATRETGREPFYYIGPEGISSNITRLSEAEQKAKAGGGKKSMGGSGG